MNGAALVAQVLKREGVEILPSFPYSDIIEEASKVGIRPIIVRQERQALHIADGYTRVLGGEKICATTVQYGPGSENAFGGVAQCFGDNVPVLHLPTGYVRNQIGTRPNFNAARSMQLINKYCEQALSVEQLPRMLEHAFAIMRNGRPGPVTIELPEDVLESVVDSAWQEGYRVQKRSAPLADKSDIRALAEMIKASRSPVIVAGQGILYSGACAELRVIAERANIPVMSTLNGKSCFPENHPLSLGCAGRSRPDTVVDFLDETDLIVGLGTSFTRSEYITPFPVSGPKFVQLTNCELDLSKDYSIDLAVIGDAKQTLKVLIQMLDGASDESRAQTREKIALSRARFMETWRPILESDDKPITPYRVLNDLMKVIDRDKSTVTHDAGSPRDQATLVYEATTPHGYLGWGKTTQLGSGLGLVQGAKLARPDWTCVNVMGDAAIGMVGMDFETGVRCQIGTTTIVYKNDLMGGYSEFHPHASEHHNINLLGGDYVAMARAFGGYGEAVTEPAEIIPSLKRAFEQNESGIPALIEIVTCEERRTATRLPRGVSA